MFGSKAEKIEDLECDLKYAEKRVENLEEQLAKIGVKNDADLLKVQQDYELKFEKEDHAHILELNSIRIQHQADISDLKSKIKTIELDTIAQYDNEVTKLQVDAAKANALASARLEVITSKDEAIAHGKEVMEVILGAKSLDFSKLQVHLNVPVTTVTTKE